MSGQAYVGTAKRTFGEALGRLLETEYRFLGSGKVRGMLVTDIEELIEEYFPIPDRLRPGWMVFTGTKASGSKAYPGQSAADHKLVTLAWPVLAPEDLEQLIRGFSGANSKKAWFQQRLVRLIEYGCVHQDGPVLLT
jgi:hypothetical protein